MASLQRPQLSDPCFLTRGKSLPDVFFDWAERLVPALVEVAALVVELAKGPSTAAIVKADDAPQQTGRALPSRIRAALERIRK